MTEAAFIDGLRALATHPAARGLTDDAAVLGDLVLTHDMIVEGVHFLPTDPPGDVAWKLLAVNLSDLAAKGAAPVGCLMGYSLAGDAAWDAAFLAGLDTALTTFAMPLLGGDTVSVPADTPRALGLTAIGRTAAAPARGGARPGDTLWVTGLIGAAGIGLARAMAGDDDGDPCVIAYRRPVPRLAEGRAIAPLASAMMDVSDGLLIDAGRMAEASGVAIAIALDALPVTPAAPPGLDAILAAATAGDDYELLFALPAGVAPPDVVRATRIGVVAAGNGLTLTYANKNVPLPARLGYLHGS
ncbi:thiamine-monophosphate kinase [Sphingomonas zeicaulis]|uniref:thiamine-phosphate kinase n=1 Tax=Sphingomonas zeicaulis TaxID=1632740 RepID=UPI003D1A80A8